MLFALMTSYFLPVHFTTADTVITDNCSEFVQCNFANKYPRCYFMTFHFNPQSSTLEKETRWQGHMSMGYWRFNAIDMDEEKYDENFQRTG